jgi:hypothetical protein
MAENTNSNETKKKNVESASERMKKAWITRRAKAMPKNKPDETKKVIQMQIPSVTVQDQVNDVLINKFLKYLDFAIENNDSGVLNTERFKSIFIQVRPIISEKKLKAS